MIFIFFIYIIYVIITAPPRYSQEDTLANAAKLEILINKKAVIYTSIFRESLGYLRDYPEYYAKVVNNIQDIEVKSGVVPYACIYTYSRINGSLVDLLLPEANFNKKVLIINPKAVNRYRDKTTFASMLIHESDHVEYMESSKLRRAALFVKCNPLLNPHISINSTLPSITHRIQTIEICAEKAQIDFHKKTETISGYEAKNGILALLWNCTVALFSDMFSLLRSLF